jgi:hypothetical protein
MPLLECWGKYSSLKPSCIVGGIWTFSLSLSLSLFTLNIKHVKDIVLYTPSDTKINEILAFEDLTAYSYSDNYKEVESDKYQKEYFLHAKHCT